MRTPMTDNARIRIPAAIALAAALFTNAAIAGTMPHPLDTEDPDQQAANRAYAESWSGRLMGCQRVALL